MTISFEGQVAVVTGAGTGLGRIYATMLAERGASVVINDLGVSVQGEGRSSVSAEAVAAAITRAGGKAVANADDVADPAGAARIVETALGAFGRIDILINNAGNLRMAPFADMPQADIDAQIAVHLHGTLYCTRAALPHMKGQGYGRVIFTSSPSGLYGLATQSPYGTAKSGVVGLMNCLVKEHKDDGIAINTISPSANTRMSVGLVRPSVERYLKAEHIAPPVLWMASRDCDVSGVIISAGAGYYTRLEMYRSDGVQFDPEQDITPEMFAGRYAEIADMSTAQPFRGNMDAIEGKLKAMGKL